MNKQIEDKFKDQDKYIGNLCDKVTRVESHICKIEKHLDMYPELEPKDSSVLFITNCETIRNLRESIQNLKANGCCTLSQKIPASTLAERTEFTRNGIDFITLPKGRFEQMQSRENLYLDIERSIKGE